MYPVDEIVRRYEDGESLRDIAKRLHYGHVTIRRVLLHAGVELRPRGGDKVKAGNHLSQLEWEGTIFLHQRGHSIAEIAATLGHGESTIRERLKNRGYA